MGLPRGLAAADPEELRTEQPSPLHVIARPRVQPSIARVAAALWRGAGGTVVDSGGFLVPSTSCERAARRDSEPTAAPRATGRQSKRGPTRRATRSTATLEPCAPEPSVKITPRSGGTSS